MLKSRARILNVASRVELGQCRALLHRMLVILQRLKRVVVLWLRLRCLASDLIAHLVS